MGKRYIILTFLLVFLLFGSIAYAHLGEEEEIHTEAHNGDAWKRLGVPNPNIITLYAAAIISLAIIGAVILRKKLKDIHKKIIFIIIAVPAVLATLYLSGTTIYLNQQAETGGPVHWHADYEIWACGEKLELLKPKGFESFVGEPLFHDHGDNRIHIEGVVLKKSDVSLGNFFKAVGGDFTGEYLGLPTESGFAEWENSDLCNGKEGKWHVFVNGEAGYGPNYVISPWQTVPPGDTIKLVFTEKNPSEINPNTGAPP